MIQLANWTRRTRTPFMKDKMSSLVIEEPTPDGTAWIQIFEDSPGKIAKIVFTIGKSGTSLNTYCYALSELSSRLLESGYSITDLIDLLLDITSDRPARAETSSRSGPEALAVALRKYLQSIDSDEAPIARFRSPRTKDNYPQREKI